MKFADGYGDEVQWRRIAEERGRLDQVFETDVVRRECWRIIAGELRSKMGDGAGWLAVGRGVDQDDVGPVAKKPEQVESAGASIDKISVCSKPGAFEVLNCGNADPFVADEQIADA